MKRSISSFHLANCIVDFSAQEQVLPLIHILIIHSLIRTNAINLIRISYKMSKTFVKNVGRPSRACLHFQFRWNIARVVFCSRKRS